MKKKIIIMCMLLSVTCCLHAQQTDYQVVFDLSTRDTISQQALVREVELIRENNPAASIEVVVYGQGLPLVLKEKSKHGEAISRLLKDPGTEFKVCAFTLKRYKMEESALLPGVTVVPDGIYEIISKQRAGWGYIKVAH